jgi:hypothetical protein
LPHPRHAGLHLLLLLLITSYHEELLQQAIEIRLQSTAATRVHAWK